MSKLGNSPAVFDYCLMLGSAFTVETIVENRRMQNFYFFEEGDTKGLVSDRFY